MSAEVKAEEGVLRGQDCPFCHKKTLTLAEKEMEIPHFGRVFLFSMTCDSCKYRKADLEAAEPHEPARWTLDVTSKEDLNARVIKSAEALVKVPHVGSIEPGPDAEGYVTNVEGIITRFKQQIEVLKETEEDDDAKKKAKNMLKKLQKVLWGDEPIKIIVEDKTGNSAIISEKAQKQKL
ncbi:ZPR1 zinc finger domain-containing protein [Candidatus Woesearchaeota archaeon]|nr:ZPR1 zinc finger domain-containing protein [Candidatus Woesearchaeota archaeon]